MTTHKIVYSSGALLDLREARLWYNLQQKKLGDKFIDDIKKTVTSIKMNPYFAKLSLATLELQPAKLFLIQFITKLMNKKI